MIPPPQTCRTTRQPTFLRLRCHRLWGHAGTDVQSAYMSQAEIEEGEAKDPVLTNARRLVESGVTQSLDRPRERLGRKREVEQPVAGKILVGLDRLDPVS